MRTTLLLALCAPALAQNDLDWAELAADFDGRGDRDRALVAWARSLADHDTSEARRELARLAEGRAALRFTMRVPGVDDQYWPGWVLSTAAGRIATGWDDVRIFDERTGALVCEPLPVAPIQLALDPTGTHVAVIEAGDRAAVWEIASRERKFELVPDWGPIAWAPDGALVARAVDVGDTWQVTVWDTATGAVLHQPEPTEEGVSELEFSSDGRYLAIAGQTVRVVDLQLGVVAANVPGDAEYRVRFHPTSPRLMILDTSRAVLRAWDLGAGTWVGPELCGYAFARNIERDPTGERWVVSQAERAVASFAETGAPAGAPLQPDDLTEWQRYKYGWEAEDLSPDGRLQAVSGVGDIVRVWDTVTGRRLGPLLRHGRRVTGLEFTEAGALVTASADGVVRIWSMDALTPLEFVADEDPSDDIFLAPSGPYALFVDELAELEIREPDGEAPTRFECPTRFTDLAVSADGVRCAAVGADSGLWTWDQTDPAARPARSTRTARAGAVAIDTRGARVVHWDEDHVVRLYDLETRAHTAHWPVPGGLEELPLDHDGLVWASLDGPMGLFGSTAAPIHGLREVEQRPLAVDAHGEAVLIGTEAGKRLEWRTSERRSGDLAALIARDDTDPVRSWLVSSTRVVAVHERSATLIDPVQGTLVARITCEDDIGLARLSGDRLMLECWPTARIYASDDGALLAAHELHGRVLALSPIPGTSRLAISSLRRALHVVDVTTNARVGRALPLTAKPSAVEVIDEDTAVLATVEGAVLVIDLCTGEAREVVPATGKEIVHIALSRDEDRLVYVEAPDVVVLRDLALGVELYRQHLALEPGPAEAIVRGSPFDDEPVIQFDPTGRTLLVAGRARIREGPNSWKSVPTRSEIVEAATGQVLCELEGTRWNTTFRQFSADGERLLAWQWKELQTWATGSGKALASIALEDRIADARLQPDGTLVSVEDEHGGFSVWETDTGAERIARRHLGGTRYQDAALSPDGRLFFAPAADDKGHWIDLATGETLAIVDDPRDIDFGPDGLVLLDRARLVRVTGSGVQRLGFRPAVISEEGWPHFAEGRYISFIDAQRVVVGAQCAEQRANPMLHEVELAVLDFGPTRHEPMSGTPAELLERWSNRLGLQATPDGRVGERAPHDSRKPR